MRFWFSGPRIAGIRTGVSFGPEDFRRASGARAAPDRPDGSFVYVLTDGHGSKIGVSTNPVARLATLQTGNPRTLSFAFVGVTPGTGYDIEAEAKVLLRHAATREGGDEWFEATTEVATAAVMGAAGRIGQKLQAVAPNQVADIIRIASGAPAARKARTDRIGFLLLEVAAAIGVAAAFISMGMPWWIITPICVVVFALMAVLTA